MNKNNVEYQVALRGGDDIYIFNSLREARKFFNDEPTATELRRVRWRKPRYPEVYTLSDGQTIVDEFYREDDEVLAEREWDYDNDKLVEKEK
jgi:hypothetical protein